MTTRFYAPPPLAPGTLRLTGPEAHHLLQVMRAEEGDQVELFDGEGSEATAVVRARARREATLEVLQVRRRSVELPRAVHLGVALPKGERQKWLVEKCVELGVASLTPLTTRRGVAEPGDKALQRLRRSVIEASKQCGRNELMQIHDGCRLAEWLAALTPPQATRWIADPRGPSGPRLPSASAPLRATIGPEGGFTDDELATADAHGWQRVSLGPRILRVETAAVAVAAAAAMESAREEEREGPSS